MKYNRLTRRHVLKAMGVSLTLPLLPSLTPKAHAATPLPRFFVSTWYPHGGISLENSYPVLGTSLTSANMFPALGSDPAHDIHSAALSTLKRTHSQIAASREQVLPDYDNGAARVSPLIGSFVPDGILNKMNVLLGVDLTHYGGHTRGYLGNYVARDGAVSAGLSSTPIPTIDSVISQSPSFYSPSERALLKTASLGVFGGNELSFFPSGASVATNPYNVANVGALYDLLFGGVSTTPGTVDPRVSVVDRVYEQYHRVVGSASAPGRRISLEDKRRLTEYMDNVKGISDRMRAITGSSCTVPAALTSAQRAQTLRQPDYSWGAGTPTTPTGQADIQRSTLELTNMLLVHAFQCGTTRIAIQKLPGLHVKWDPNHFNDAPTSGATDTHQQLFHRHGAVERQQYLMETQRFLFRYAFLDLVQRMDAVELVPGTTLLDQALVYWGSEAGATTHNAVSLPTILAGKAGGYFKTGNYVDYRNLSRPVLQYNQTTYLFGVPQNRLLANICQAMGLSRAEYELSDGAYTVKFPARGGKVPGYGDPAISFGGFNKPAFIQRDLDAMSDKLPVVT